MKAECFMLTDKINRKKSGSDVSLWIVVLWFSKLFETCKEGFDKGRVGVSIIAFHCVLMLLCLSKGERRGDVLIFSRPKRCLLALYVILLNDVQISYIFGFNPSKLIYESAQLQRFYGKYFEY